MSFTNGHALLIGVGKFNHNQNWNVSHTKADAQEIEKILKDPQFCGYPANQVHLLTEDQASKSHIETGFQELAKATTAKDTVFIYIASHGSFGTNSKWHLMPHDAVGDDKMILEPSSAISEARLAELVQALPAERVIIFLNTCHSGHAAVGTLGDSNSDLASSNPTEDGLNTLLGSGKGRIIITACGNDQFSLFERGKKLTVFGKELARALKGIGSSSSRGNFIGAFDIYNLLYVGITDRAQELSEADDLVYEQEPEITVQKTVGPFPVALRRGKAGTLGRFNENPGEIEEGSPREITPEEIKQSIETVFGDGAQQFINNGGTMNVINGTSNIIGDNNQIINGRNNTIVGKGGVNIGGNISSGSSININTGNSGKE